MDKGNYHGGGVANYQLVNSRINDCFAFLFCDGN